MPEKIKIGIIRETKTPPDRRVVLPPKQLFDFKQQYPDLDLVVQSSKIRCFTDDEYARVGVLVAEDLSDCDILLGVKEVEISCLIPGKTYFFFSHVGKEQPYNRDLLRALLDKNIRLIDYEYLTNQSGTRLIAFGRWAGIVGAYNALRGWGHRTGNYSLRPAHECHDRQEMDAQLDLVNLISTRILISGGGRAAQGTMETMHNLGVRVVPPEDYLKQEFKEAVCCRIDPWHYVEHRPGKKFDLNHFFEKPSEYKSTFSPYARATDIYIAAHYWDPDSPRMFEIKDMLVPAFRIGMIADISCDINGSVPINIRATTIADPFYGYDPKTGKETNPFRPLPPVTMMTVDNLPGELPRDSSSEFASVLVRDILPRLSKDDPEGVIDRATITENGKLTDKFGYLEGYVKGG